MAAQSDDRSLGDLFAELSRETGTLIRQEVQLATSEMSTKLKTAGMHAGVIAAGGALAHAGLLALIAAVVLGLSEMGVPAWLSALIVAVAVMLIGYALVNSGMAKMRSTSLAPRQTMESLKETASWTSKTRA
jgi:drug/metabolite transporter (DMT)-like permease